MHSSPAVRLINKILYTPHFGANSYHKSHPEAGKLKTNQTPALLNIISVNDECKDVAFGNPPSFLIE